MLKLLSTTSLLNQSANFQVPQGQYGKFLLRYSGVPQAATTITLAECGQMNLNVNGQDIQNVDVDLLSQLANLYGGVIEASAVAGTSFAFSIIVFVAHPNDKQNIFDIGSLDKVLFNLSFPLLTVGLIISGTVTIWGEPKAGIQSYYYKILSKAVVGGGAGPVSDTIPEANISQLFIKNPTALIDSIQLWKDNKVYVNGQAAVELVISNWTHQLESPSTLLAEEFVAGDNLQSVASQQLQYQLNFTGAGTLAMYYASLKFSQTKQEESIVNFKTSLIN